MIGIAMLLITQISKLEKCQVGSQLKRKLYQNEQTFSINTESFSNGQRVIVKESSPKNLSADFRSTVGRQLADRRPTGFARNIGYLSADSGPTVGRLLVMCR